MTTRITVPITEEERVALIELSKRERRHPRDQGALLIRHELERLGMLPTPERAAITGGEHVAPRRANIPVPVAG